MLVFPFAFSKLFVIYFVIVNVVCLLYLCIYVYIYFNTNFNDGFNVLLGRIYCQQIVKLFEHHAITPLCRAYCLLQPNQSPN
jgi:hypothetical protein